MTAVGALFYIGVGLSSMSAAFALWGIERHLARIADQPDGPRPGSPTPARLVAAAAAHDPAHDDGQPAARSGPFIDGVRFHPTGGLRVGDPYPVPLRDFDTVDPCIAIRHGSWCVRDPHDDGTHVAVDDGRITALWGGPGAELAEPHTDALTLAALPPRRHRDNDTGEHDFGELLDDNGRPRLAALDDAGRGVSR